MGVNQLTLKKKKRLKALNDQEIFKLICFCFIKLIEISYITKKKIYK